MINLDEADHFMKMHRHQEVARDFLIDNSHVAMYTPPGLGMDVAIAEALRTKSDLKKSIVVVDSKPVHQVWNRTLKEAGVEADLLSPEKLVKDFSLYGEVPEYDVVVWNVSNRGRKTVDVMSMLANKATTVWVRRLEYWTSNMLVQVLKDFRGPFKVLMFETNPSDIYPKQVEDKEVLARILKRVRG